MTHTEHWSTGGSHVQDMISSAGSLARGLLGGSSELAEQACGQRKRDAIAE